MAINTSGFGIRAMPQATLADPSLVAFNPGSVLGGAAQSFQLASLLEQVRAQRQRRALMDAVMQGEIAAQNAKNRQIVDVTPAQTGDILGGINQRAATRDAETNALLSGFNLQTGQNIGELGLLGKSLNLKGSAMDESLRKLTPLTDAEIAKAAAEKAKAQSDVSLSALRETGEAAKINSLIKDIEDADSIRKSHVERALAENKAAKAKATMQEEVMAADHKLETDLKKANADYLKAHAQYFERGGRPASEKDVDQQIRALAMSAKNLEDVYGLAAYESDTYDAGGALKSKYFGMSEAKQDASKEKAMVLRNKYRDVIFKLLSSQMDQLGGGQRTPPPPSAIEHLRKNPNMKSQFDQKYGTGSADKYLKPTPLK